MRRSLKNTIKIIGFILFLIVVPLVLQEELSLKYFIYLILTLVLNFFMMINIHELGHLIIGLMEGFKLYAYHLACFCIDKIDGKFKFSIDLSGFFGGLTSMNLVEGKSTLAYVIYFSAGIFMNLISIPIIFLLFGVNSYTIINNTIILLVVIKNIIPLDLAGMYNDGYLIRSFIRKDEIYHYFFLINRVDEALINGARPRDLVLEEAKPITNLYELNYELFRYYYYLDNQDFKNAKEVMRKIILKRDLLNRLVLETVYTEFIFYYSFLNPNLEKAKYYYERVNFGTDITAFRSKIALNILTETDNTATYENLAKATKEFPGTYLMEVDLINYLKEVEQIKKHNKRFIKDMAKALDVLANLDYMLVGDYALYLKDEYTKIRKNIILVDKEKIDGFKNLFRVKEILGVSLDYKYQDYIFNKKDIKNFYLNGKKIKISKNSK